MSFILHIRVGDRTDLRTLCRDRILYRVGRQTLYTLQSICHALGAQLRNIFIYRFDQWHPQSLQRIIHEFYWHSIFTPSTNNWLTQIIHILVLGKWHNLNLPLSTRRHESLITLNVFPISNLPATTMQK
jgi:hypothetical protein